MPASGLFKRCSSSRVGRGYTLTELVVVVAILGILTAAAMPSFSSFILSQRIRMTTSDLYSALIMARSEAIKRNTTANVVATGGDWQNGWTVQVSGLTLQTQAAPTGVTVTTMAGTPTTVSYAYNGRVLAGSAGSAFTIYSAGTSAQARCISLGLSGIPQIKVDGDNDPSNGC